MKFIIVDSVKGGCGKSMEALASGMEIQSFKNGGSEEKNKKASSEKNVARFVEFGSLGDLGWFSYYR